jgi:hypothetical protein
MKEYKIQRIAKFALLLSVFLYGCSDGFLDREPQSELLTSNYYKNANECQSALIGVYDVLGINDQYYGAPSGGGSYFRGLLVVGNVGTDECIVQRPFWMGDHNNIEYYLTNPSTDLIYLIWRNMYLGISRANTLLDRIPATSDPSEMTELERIKGEAYFLRALFYWHLVKFYGGVPLITSEIKTPDDIIYTRATIEDTYKQIISDLEKAINLLDYRTGGNYASRGAAEMLLGMAYLQMCGPQVNNNNNTASLAVEVLKNIIENSGSNLLMNYADVYKLTNENNEEIIFNVEFSNQPSEYGQVTAYFGPGNQVVTNSYGILLSTQEHFYSYDTLKDSRWANNVAAYSINISGSEYVYEPTSREDPLNDYAVNKFRLPLPERTDQGYPYLEWQSPMNYPIMKFSDALLLYAEAECRANDGPTDAAYTAINRIRKRAGLENLTPGLDYNGFMDSLLQERSWELCFEGKRWEDLVRFGKLIETVQQLTTTNPLGAENIKEHHIFMPIPQIEITLSNGVLIQNDGY